MGTKEQDKRKQDKMGRKEIFNCREKEGKSFLKRPMDLFIGRGEKTRRRKKFQKREAFLASFARTCFQLGPSHTKRYLDFLGTTAIITYTWGSMNDIIKDPHLHDPASVYVTGPFSAMAYLATNTQSTSSHSNPH